MMYQCKGSRRAVPPCRHRGMIDLILSDGRPFVKGRTGSAHTGPTPAKPAPAKAGKRKGSRDRKQDLPKPTAARRTLCRKNCGVSDAETAPFLRNPPLRFQKRRQTVVPSRDFRGSPSVVAPRQTILEKRGLFFCGIASERKLCYTETETKKNKKGRGPSSAVPRREPGIAFIRHIERSRKP